MTDEKKSGDALVVVEPESGSFSLAEFAELGLIAPIADLGKIRAAFSYKQKLLAAILDPSDYIYSAEVREGNRTYSRNVASLEEAQKVAKTCGTSYRASPKKSGIVKLAVALGITAVRQKTLGLPDDPGAHHAYVEYLAVHEKTGQSQLGVGWCDRGERNTPLKTHEIVATADTRAYNRAILRLSGFGDVSAEEMDAIGDEQRGREPFGGFQEAHRTETPTVTAVVVTKPKAPLALPAASDATVLTASQAWLDATTQRGSDPLPAAQQSAKAFREMRARARRGSVEDATQMGKLGLRWEGIAQDDPDTESFNVERETVSSVTTAPTNGPATKPEGWDLSGHGGKTDDVAPPAESVSFNIPQPDPSKETITIAAAKRLSSLLIENFVTADGSREWLKAHARVGRSQEIRENQYDAIASALTKLAESKRKSEPQQEE